MHQGGPTSAVELVSLRLDAVQVVLLVSDRYLQLLDLPSVVVPQAVARGLQGGPHAHCLLITSSLAEFT